MKRKLIFLEKLIAILLLTMFIDGLKVVNAQEVRKINLDIFGAIDFTANRPKGTTNTFFTLGEQDFFVTAKISDKFSFLGETVVRSDAKTATTFSASIERAQMKYDYKGNHSIVVGKMHTPVNYWNDVYHHGRVFFPTIDRPVAFSHFIPLHTMGIKFQGQNLGKLNFGYDVVFGNGISSTDFNKTGSNLSSLFSMHIKPVQGLRLQTTYYYDYLRNNYSGVHSGHLHPFSTFSGSVSFNMINYSVAYFGSVTEILVEGLVNVSRTDSLGVASNHSNFVYIGKRIAEKNIPYILIDYTDVSPKELHVDEFRQLQFGFGFRHEFNYKLNLKAHVLRNKYEQHHEQFTPDSWLDLMSFKIQLAYGL